MHKWLVGALWGALTMTGSAVAAGLDPHQMIASFTQDNVGSLVQAMGYGAEPLNDSDGTKAVGITAPSGMKFIAQPTACQKSDNQECSGLIIVAIFRDAVPGDVLSKFNAKHAFTSSYGDGGGTYLLRYEISDYGIPIGNVISNVGNFDKVAQLFVTFVRSAGTGASLTPAPTEKPALQSFAGATIRPISDEPLFKPTAKQQAYINRLSN